MNKLLLLLSLLPGYRGEENRLCHLIILGSNFTPPLPGCVSLSKSYHLSVPPFSLLQNGRSQQSLPPGSVVKMKPDQAWKKPFGVVPGTQSALHKWVSAVRELQIRRAFLGHFPYARHLLSHTWARAIAVSMFLMESQRQGCCPHRHPHPY